MEFAIFVIFAALALAGALGVVLASNPVHCALSLVVTLISVAVFFLQQDAQPLGAIVLAEVLFLAGRTWATGAPSQRGSLDAPVDGDNLNNIERVARVLFT